MEEAMWPWRQRVDWCDHRPRNETITRNFKRREIDSPLEREEPCQYPGVGTVIQISYLWLPDLGENHFLLFKATKFVMYFFFFYSRHNTLIQALNSALHCSLEDNPWFPNQNQFEKELESNGQRSGFKDMTSKSVVAWIGHSNNPKLKEMRYLRGWEYS